MDNIVTIWLVAGIILILSEAVIPGFTIFFFGAGALVTSLIIKLIPELQDVYWLQFIIFTGFSLSTLILLRKRFRFSFRGELHEEEDNFTGKECLVTEETTPEISGRISFMGTTWTAITEDGVFKTGDKAIISGKKANDNMTFIIKKAKEQK